MQATPRHLERTYAISVYGFLRSVQLAFPMIEARGGGTIVGISGADTRTWIPTHGILAGAKAAMETMIRYLAAENGDSGVTILGVNPGAVDTQSVDVMLGELAGELLKMERASHPLRRVASPDDVGKAVVLLCTPAACWAHGTVVDLDGGGIFALYGRYAQECLNQITGPAEEHAPVVRALRDKASGQ
jgi:NAD(P)-dependent dehydrogenase (short-subunit alcohol dehydrogenase family)